MSATKQGKKAISCLHGITLHAHFPERVYCDNRMLSLPGFLPPADLWALKEERLSGSSPHSFLGKKGSRSCPVRRKIRKEGIVEKTSSFSVHGYLNYWISGIGLVAL